MPGLSVLPAERIMSLRLRVVSWPDTLLDKPPTSQATVLCREHTYEFLYPTPRTPAGIEALVCQMARENIWGYNRIQGELKKLNIEISETTVTNTLCRKRPRLSRVPRFRNAAFSKSPLGPSRCSTNINLSKSRASPPAHVSVFVPYGLTSLVFFEARHPEPAGIFLKLR